MATTRRAIRQRLLQELSLGFNGTATGGAATTLIDTGRLQNSGADSRNYVNMYLNMPAAAAADQARTITTYAPTTGTLTQGGVNYTVSPASTDIYEIIKWIHPTDLNNAINRGIEKLWYETWMPISLITDYDMESSGVSSWTATNATSSKITTTGYFQDQALQVANSAANGYAQSASVGVTPGAFGFAGATVACPTTGDKFEFTVWDVTNSAVIGSVVEAVQLAQHQVYVSFTVPSTCYQVALRLGGEGANDTTVWDNAILHIQHQNRFNAPSWLTKRDQLLSVRRQVSLGSPVTGASAQLAYPNDALMWPIVPVSQLEIDPTGTVPMRLVLAEYAYAYPIWVQALRQYAVFTADTSTGGTIDCDENYAVAAAKVEVLEYLNGKYKGKFQSQLQQAQRGFGAIARVEAPRGPRLWKPAM